MFEEIQQINYKGLLQQYCLLRYPSPPVYETRKITVENDNLPQWMVSIQCAKDTFETSKPISGSKKHAEQEAAKQLMEKLESKQTEFLAGNQLPNRSNETTSEATIEKTPISVPPELVSTALQVASQQLSASSNIRQGPYRQTKNDDFVKLIGQLTIKIIHSVVEAAEEKNGVDFGQRRLDLIKNNQTAE